MKIRSIELITNQRHQMKWRNLNAVIVKNNTLSLFSCLDCYIYYYSKRAVDMADNTFACIRTLLQSRNILTHSDMLPFLTIPFQKIAFQIYSNQFFQFTKGEAKDFKVFVFAF